MNEKNGGKRYLEDSNTRIDWVDAQKGILIYLVVLGHTISGEISLLNSLYGYIHYMIYSVHMALFFILSGFVVKQNNSLRTEREKILSQTIIIIIKYIVPYVCFDFVYIVWSYLRGMPFFVNKNILFPSSVYWFIFALAFIKIIDLLCNDKIMIVLAVVSFVLSAFLSEKSWDFLACGRIALMMPCYIAGKYIRRNWLLIKKHKSIMAVTGICSVIVGALLLILNVVPIYWATHDYTNDWKMYFLKTIYLAISVGIFLFFSSCKFPVPNFLIRWGKNSIIIYLLHPFVLDVFKKYMIMYFGIYWAYWKSWFWILVILWVAFLTYVLSLDIIRKIYDYVFLKIPFGILKNLKRIFKKNK